MFTKEEEYCFKLLLAGSRERLNQMLKAYKNGRQFEGSDYSPEDLAESAIEVEIIINMLMGFFEIPEMVFKSTEPKDLFMILMFCNPLTDVGFHNRYRYSIVKKIEDQIVFLKPGYDRMYP